MKPLPVLVPALRKLGRRVRDRVVEACEAQSQSQLRQVAEDGPGDTIYEIDRLSEELLIAGLEPAAQQVGGIVLLAEGLPPEGVLLGASSFDSAAFRLLVDPIDGTRGLMYQKRSAWVLMGLAPNRGSATCLRDIQLAVQVEIPTVKQHLCDELWAVAGQGAFMERFDRIGGQRRAMVFEPSSAASLRHGYAMITRFFPGAREELAAIDEEVIRQVLGPSPEGKALCFEDQYASSGGQLYELAVGHDRFNADLRPLLGDVLEARGEPLGLCCHPYDLCTWLIAEQAGVILTTPSGEPLNAPFDLEARVAWVGYANVGLRAQVEPALQASLARRGWLSQGQS